MSVLQSDGPVDDLIRDLGELRVAADAAQADEVARRVIDAAIADAARAVSAILRNPDSPEILSNTQQIVRRSAELVTRLQSEATKARRLSSAAAGLRLAGRERREG